MKQKIALIMVMCVLIASLTTTGNTAQAKSTSTGWKKAYDSIIKNWKNAEKNKDYKGESDYLKFSFGKDYKYDRYLLLDIDGNNTPELILYSTTMTLATVFTYSNNKLVFLMTNDINKINTKTGEIIIHGHWHGAGGS